jgi:hypothetical protein
VLVKSVGVCVVGDVEEVSGDLQVVAGNDHDLLKAAASDSG